LTIENFKLFFFPSFCTGEISPKGRNKISKYYAKNRVFLGGGGGLEGECFHSPKFGKKRVLVKISRFLWFE
jgi:hypothetical protein